MTRFSLAVLALALTASPAVAQNKSKKPAPGAPAAPAAPAAKGKVKVLNMGEIDVEGDTVTKPFTNISVAEAATSSSLIRIRHDFIDLILKSGESL